MIVSKPILKTKASYHELSAVVRCEQHWRPPIRIWIRFPLEARAYLSDQADPFLAGTLLPAMALGERLRIEGDVSPLLLTSVEKIQALYSAWFKVRTITVSAGTRVQSPIGPNAVGCFFSGGVDSFFSLLKKGRHCGEEPEAITHLIFIHGYDIPLRNKRLFASALERIQMVARAERKQLLLASSNLKQFGRKFVSYGHYFGAATVAIGLAYGGLLRRVIIPSSYAQEQQRPWGSHPLLDPLWSTETTAFVHDGCEATRLEKTAEICRSKLALSHLRVCWKNRHGRYNCGECEKCLRTMLELYAVGGLARCDTFAEPLSPLLVRRKLRLKDEAGLVFAEETLAELARRSGGEALTAELTGVLREAVARGRERVKKGVSTV